MKVLTSNRSIRPNQFNRKALAAATCIVLAASCASAMAGGVKSEAAINWTRVATEGQTFSTVGTQMVRYGYNGKWIKKSITGSAACNTSTFGSDPAPGVTNVCETRNATAASGSAVLTWTASTDSKVTDYRIYYGTSSGSYSQAPGTGLSAGNRTSYTVTGLPSGKLYYFSVTAADAAGNESAQSNETNKVIP